MDTREERGRQIATDSRIRHVEGAAWIVPSQTQNAGSYVVNTTEGTCSCPDWETRRSKCKHLWAVEIVRTVALLGDGSTVTTESVKVTRKTYQQPDWPAYNAAQCAEKTTVQVLLKDLCSGIVTPPHAGRGRKPIPLADAVYGMTMKVYSTVSGRRATGDLEACASAGHMLKAPRYNTIFDYFEKPSMTPLLTSLVEESASPLAAIDRSIAVDSTGFGTVNYTRWFDHKYGKEMKQHGWVKAHASVGTITNVVTAVRVTDGTGADCPELPALVERTSQRFTISEVSADKAYLSHANLAAIEKVGARPFIAPKVNTTGEGSEAMRRMFGLFLYRQDEFLAAYHRRSNVESTFGAIKRKFGASVRSKTFPAQVNEVLCKVLCHNLSQIVHGMHELGIEPTFFTGTRAA